MSKLNNSVHRDKSKAVGPKTVYEWTDCVNGGDVLQTRRENGTSRRTYYWSKGDKPERLVYHARFIPSGPNTLVWTEGAHCARFASAKLPPDSFDVVAFVSCSILPDIQALRSVALGRHCIVWPDAIDGIKVGETLARKLQGVAASVRILQPDKIGLTTKGDDAEQWRPGSDPKAAIESACLDVRTVENNRIDAEIAENDAEIAENDAPRFLRGDDPRLGIEEKPSWFIEGLIPRKSVTVIAGRSGAGKSVAVASLLAWRARPVVWCGLEDDVNAIARPRWRCAGGRASLIHWYTRTVAEAISGEMLEELRGIVADTKAEAVVFDTISSWFPESEINEAKLFRGFVDRLAPLMVSTGVAVLAIHHIRKAGGDAVDRIAGSHQVVAAARSALLVLTDPENNQLRLLCHAKSNYSRLATTRQFTITGGPAKDEDVAVVSWEGDDARSADDLSRVTPVEPETVERDAADVDTLLTAVQTALKNDDLPRTGVSLDRISTRAILEIAKRSPDDYELPIGRKNRVGKLLRLAKSIRYDSTTKQRFAGGPPLRFVYKADIDKWPNETPNETPETPETPEALPLEM